MIYAPGPEDARWIVVAGDVSKIEPSRHYFRAVIAGLQTAREYLIEIEAELASANEGITEQATLKLAAIDRAERAEALLRETLDAVWESEWQELRPRIRAALGEDTRP